MASALAESVVKKVCEIAVQQVLNEVSILSNFTEDFELLKDRIEEMNNALNEANEESTGQKESAKKWLHRVRDIAWEAEDILEECAVDSMYATDTQLCTLPCNQLILRHKMGRRIQKVKARLSSVVEEGNQLSVVSAAVPRKEEAESSSRSQGQQSKKSSLPPSDSKPVGIESKIESMGGIGKTYLLQHLYNSRKERYDKSAWISVSQFYSVSKLQRGLAFQLDEKFGEKINKAGLDEEVAAQSIHGFLLGKRCLIVLDDVWRATREADLPTKLGIPTGDSSQCKILISTRNREVAVNLNAEIYEMERLTDEESWSLFCAYAFPRTEENRASEYLEEVARNIVKECGKLPLAIKTIAASLASTTMPSDWHSKLSKLKNVGTANDPVMDILKLSYHSLPAHLKACFAYFSFFPEDEEIECQYLIYLWMGEGFIPAGENPWNCLDQLANLSLVEVWEEERYMNKYCKIHDLLLDLAILISRENKCAFSFQDAFSKLRSVNTRGSRWCRLFLAKKEIDEHAISKRHPVSPILVRTLSLSCNSQIGGNIPAMLFKGMRVLRVLDLSYTDISTLPTCVGEMKLLRVLNLRGTRIEKIPKCVRCLKSLTFFDVSECEELEQRQAPKWISELKCLQHLQGPFKRMPKGISKLESLRTLRTGFLSLSMKEDGVLKLEDVGKMSEIEEIFFNVENELQLKRLEEGILAPLLNMRRLEVKNVIHGQSELESESESKSESELDLPQFPERMSAMRNLEHLRLSYFAVPNWICCLTNLRRLFLQDCHCSNYPEIQAMPNLVSLWLWVNKRCSELPKAFGKSGGFPHLRFFFIYHFFEMEGFPEMEDGAMACLEKLEIFNCRKLNKMGEGLERLKRLKEISIEFSGTDELREMLKEGGKYWKKIKDFNPQIRIDIKY